MKLTTMKCKASLMLAALATLAAGTVYGQVAVWNAGDGDLETDTNWDPVGVPDETTDVYFTVSDGAVAVTSESGLTNANVMVSGSGTVTFELDNKDVAYRAEGSFTVKGGAPGPNAIFSRGAFFGGDVRLGAASGEDGNSLVVRNGATLTSVGKTYVGYSGDGNEMVVSNGAYVLADGGLYMGSGELAYTNSHNSLLVTGEGTKLEVMQSNCHLWMGLWSDDNTVTVSDGAVMNVLGSYGTIYFWDGSRNRLVVSNATVNTGHIYMCNTTGKGLPTIGYGVLGKDNVIEICDNGYVSSWSATIGSDPSSTGNGIIVSGTGSVLNVHSSGIFIGQGANGCFLTVTNGGRALMLGPLHLGTGGLSVGGESWQRNGSFNTLVIAGTEEQDAYVSLGGPFFLGNENGHHNAAYITRGSMYGSRNLVIGYAGGNGNRVVLNKGYLSVVDGGIGQTGTDIGPGGSGNELILDNASHLYCGNFRYDSFVGKWVTANGNRFEVKGGSTVEICGDYYVGMEGANGNVLRIEGQGSEIYTFFENPGWCPWIKIVVGGEGESNRLEVVDGGTLTLYHGISVAKTNNVLRLENGTIDLLQDPGNVQRGVAAWDGARIEIAGTNNLIDIRKRFSLQSSATLRFEMEPGMSAGPIIRTYAAYGAWGGGNLIWGQWGTYYENSFENDGTARLEIDAQRFAAAGGGVVTLIEAVDEQGTRDNLAALAGNVTWVNGVSGSLAIESAGWINPYSRVALVATIPNVSGTMILLR